MIERGEGLPAPDAAKRIEVATSGEVSAAELLGVAPVSSSKPAGMSDGSVPFIQQEVMFSPALLTEAASYDLDPVKIARDAVERAVKTERMKRFSDANREAIASWNDLVQREGLWSDGLRLF